MARGCQDVGPFFRRVYVGVPVEKSPPKAGQKPIVNSGWQDYCCTRFGWDAQALIDTLE